jgi:hypothetical protein
MSTRQQSSGRGKGAVPVLRTTGTVSASSSVERRRQSNRVKEQEAAKAFSSATGPEEDEVDYNEEEDEEEEEQDFLVARPKPTTTEEVLVRFEELLDSRNLYGYPQHPQSPHSGEIHYGDKRIPIDTEILDMTDPLVLETLFEKVSSSDGMKRWKKPKAVLAVLALSLQLKDQLKLPRGPTLEGEGDLEDRIKKWFVDNGLEAEFRPYLARLDWDRRELKWVEVMNQLSKTVDKEWEKEIPFNVYQGVDRAEDDVMSCPSEFGDDRHGLGTVQGDFEAFDERCPLSDPDAVHPWPEAATADIKNGPLAVHVFGSDLGYLTYLLEVEKGWSSRLELYIRDFMRSLALFHAKLRKLEPLLKDRADLFLRGNTSEPTEFGDVPVFLAFDELFDWIRKLVRADPDIVLSANLKTVMERNNRFDAQIKDLNRHAKLASERLAEQEGTIGSLRAELKEEQDHAIKDLDAIKALEAALTVREEELKAREAELNEVKSEHLALKCDYQRAYSQEARLRKEVEELRAQQRQSSQSSAAGQEKKPEERKAPETPVGAGGSNLFDTSQKTSNTGFQSTNYGGSSFKQPYSRDNRPSWDLAKVANYKKVPIVERRSDLTGPHLQLMQQFFTAWMLHVGESEVPGVVFKSMFMPEVLLAIYPKVSTWYSVGDKNLTMKYEKYFIFDSDLGDYKPEGVEQFWSLPYLEIMSVLTQIFGSIGSSKPRSALTEDDWAKTMVAKVRTALGNQTWTEEAMTECTSIWEDYVKTFVTTVFDKGAPYRDVDKASQTRVIKLVMTEFLATPEVMPIDQNYFKILLVEIFSEEKTTWPSTFAEFDHLLRKGISAKWLVLSQLRSLNIIPQGKMLALPKQNEKRKLEDTAKRNDAPEGPCPVCGNPLDLHEKVNRCPYWDHPDANKNRSIAYKDSRQGQELRRRDGYLAIPDRKSELKRDDESSRKRNREEDRRRDRQTPSRGRESSRGSRSHGTQDRNHEDRSRDDRNRSDRERSRTRDRESSRPGELNRHHYGPGEVTDKSRSSIGRERVAALDNRPITAIRGADQRDRRDEGTVDTVSTTRTMRDMGPGSSTPIISVYISPILNIKERTALNAVVPGTAVSQRAEVGDIEIGPLRAMIDTGASHDNYIREDVAQLLISKGGQRLPCQSKICSGLTSHQFCVDCEGIFKFNLKFKNDLLNTSDSIQISAKVGPVPEPIFIGDPTCRENALVLKCFGAFVDQPLSSALTPDERFGLIGLISGNASSTLPFSHRDPIHHMSWSSVPSSAPGLAIPVHPIFHWLNRARYSERWEDSEEGTVSKRLFELLPPARLNSLSRISTICRIYKKSELLTEEPDEDYVFEEEDPPDYASAAPTGKKDTIEDLMAKMTIQGSESFLARIKEIITVFRDRFSEVLSPLPADIPAMELDVDSTKWRIPQNSGPARRQSAEKQTATREFVEDARDKGVIHESFAPHYSQVHLTPKPHPVPGEPVKWRFCIYFRA